MKRNFKFFTLILFIISVLFCKSITSLAITFEELPEVRGLEEPNKIYGSILYDEYNYAYIKVSPIIYRELQRTGFENISVKLAGFGFGPYDVPVLRKKSSFGSTLIVDLSKAKDLNGKIISPASIPFGSYNIYIIPSEGKLQGLQLVSKEFTYFPPAITAFQINSGTSVVFVENLDGKVISDSTVAATPGEKQIIEVRSNNFYIPFDEKTIVVLHAVAGNNKNLLALADIQASPSFNSVEALQPVTITDKNSFLAHLVKNTQSGEIVKNFLKDNPDALRKVISAFPDNEADCEIEQFIDFCPSETFSEIGEGFKDFLEIAMCNNINLDLYKEVVKNIDNNRLGTLYCEYFRFGLSPNLVCNFYSDILKKFNSNKLPKLPCPPEICNEFKNIKPPKCGNFVICNEGDTNPLSEQCIKEPKKDLFCRVIENQAQEDVCKNDPRGFTTVSSSDGIKYCVPVSNPENIIEECKLIECHKKCEIPLPQITPKPTPTPSDPPFVGPISNPVSNPPTQPIVEPPFVFPTRDFDSDRGLQTSEEPVKPEEPIKPINKECHLKCDAEAGRKVDCSNPNSEFFSIKCCDPKTQESIIITDPTTSNSSARRFRISTSDFPSLKNCLCKEPANFDEKGFIKKETVKACENICPEGFVLNEFGKCICPECKGIDKQCPKGEKLDLVTGKCVKEIKCEKEQFLDTFGVCRCSSDGSIPGAEGCKKKEEINKENICPAGAGPSITIPCKCAPPAVAVGNECVCPPNKIYAGEKGCVEKGKEGELAICPAGTGPSLTIPCKCKEPAKAVGNECICPQGELAVYAGEKGCIEKKKGGGELPICPAGTGPSLTIPCKCKKPATPSGIGNECTCEKGKVYAGEKGCIDETVSDVPICTPTQFKSAIIPCKCAQGAEFSDEGLCKCLNGKSYTVNGCSEGTITTVCGSQDQVEKIKCTCASGAKVGTNGTCQCIDGGTYTKDGCIKETICTGEAKLSADGKCQCPKTNQTYTEKGCKNPVHTCVKDEVSTELNPCTCASPAKLNTKGICECSVGESYSESGCKKSTICQKGEKTTTSGCTCATGATVGSDSTCQCKSGENYTVQGCTTTTCSVNQASTTLDPCACKGTATPTGAGVCVCPNGKDYSPTLGGCPD